MGSEDVYITGIDMIKFGKFLDRSIASLGAEAALGALDDAQVTINDIEALYSGNLMMAAGMVGQQIQQEIGQTGIPVINVANACATGATALREEVLNKQFLSFCIFLLDTLLFEIYT